MNHERRLHVHVTSSSVASGMPHADIVGDVKDLSTKRVLAALRDVLISCSKGMSHIVSPNEMHPERTSQKPAISLATVDLPDPLGLR